MEAKVTGASITNKHIRQRIEYLRHSKMENLSSAQNPRTAQTRKAIIATMVIQKINALTKLFILPLPFKSQLWYNSRHWQATVPIGEPASTHRRLQVTPDHHLAFYAGVAFFAASVIFLASESDL